MKHSLHHNGFIFHGKVYPVVSGAKPINLATIPLHDAERSMNPVFAADAVIINLEIVDEFKLLKRGYCRNFTGTNLVEDDLVHASFYHPTHLSCKRKVCARGAFFMLAH